MFVWFTDKKLVFHLYISMKNSVLNKFDCLTNNFKKEKDNRASGQLNNIPETIPN